MIEVEHELTLFRCDPFAWSQEWTEKNGKIVMGEVEVLNLNEAGEPYGSKRSYVCLHVDGRDTPVSTGVHNTLALAFENAIKGLNNPGLIGL